MESAINAVKYAFYLCHVKSDIKKLMPQRLHIKYPIHRQPVLPHSLEHTRDRNYLTSSWSKRRVRTRALFPNSRSWRVQGFPLSCWHGPAENGTLVQTDAWSEQTRQTLPWRGEMMTRGKFQSRVTEHKHCCSHPMSGHKRDAKSWRSQGAKSGPEPANEPATRGHGQTGNSEAELSQRCRLKGDVGRGQPPHSGFPAHWPACQ